MNRIATVTVIRGSGDCEAYVDGIVQEEIEKMKSRHNTEIQAKNAELEATKIHRNKLLSSKLGVIRAESARPISRFTRIRNKIDILWCKFWGIGYELGLWTCNDD